jgi:hypothetical protein
MVEAREREMIRAAVARLRAGITAVVFGMVCGFGLLVATVWLLLRGGPQVGKTLNLLGNYFPGYSVTWPGALVGLLYGLAFGGAVGFSTAWIYNRITDLREKRRSA